MNDRLRGSLSCTLPVSCPVTGRARRQRGGSNAASLLAIGKAAMILPPCHLVRVGREIRPRDMMVRPNFGTAKAAEIAFGLIGADALVHEANTVIDAPRIPTGVKRIPTCAFVGVDGRECPDVIANERHRIAFLAD